MAIARAQFIGAHTSVTATTLSATWPGATTLGSTLVLAVSWNANGTNGITASVPGGWTIATSATRVVGGSDFNKTAVYLKQNAASASGSVTATFSSAVHASVHLVELTGAASASLDVTATDSGSSLAADSGTTSTTTQAAEYLLALISNSNNASTQSAPTNTFVLVDQQTSGGSGTVTINTAIYDRTVAATSTYGTAVTLSGATSRAWTGITVTFKQASAGAAVQASFGTGSGGTSFRSWTGMSARTTSSDVSSNSANYAGTFNLRSCYKYWYQFEPSKGGYNWTGLDASLQAAADSSVSGHRWKLILRIEMGFAAPGWVFSDLSNPVPTWFFVDSAHNTSPGASADNNHVPRVFDGSGVFDTNLEVHVIRMLKQINTHLSQADGHGGHFYDHVYFVAVAAPTVQPGTEMTTEPGPSAALPNSFTYDGPAAFASGTTTYRQINTNVWNSIGSAANRQTWFKNAWSHAIDLHMQYLTVARSAVAYGSLFGDGWSGSESIATTKGAQYGDRLVGMTTSLQTDTTPYPTGTYKGWSAQADQTMKNAIAAGSPVGFQTAGGQILTNEAKYWAAFSSGLGDYDMAFFETAPNLAANYQTASTTGTGWPGAAAAQALLTPDPGNNPGQITGQAGVTLTPTVIAQSKLYALDTFSRTSVNTWGSADQGGAYTLTGTAADFDVGGGVGTIIVAAAGSGGTKEANLANIGMDDTDIRLQWSCNIAPAGAPLRIRVYARKVDANNLYKIGVVLNTNGSLQLDARVVAAGVDTQIGAVATTGLSFTTDTQYWLRARVENLVPDTTTITAKLWTDGSAEPAGWMLSVTDTAVALQGTGSVSIVCRADTSATSVPATFSTDGFQVFPDSPTVEADGVADVGFVPTTNNVAAGTGHKYTPRS